MKINYRILSKNENEHSIVVRFYTDLITEESLATEFNPDNSIKMSENGNFPSRCRTDYNINVFQTPSPDADRLIEIIMASAPVDWFNMQEQILNEKVDTSLSSVDPLLHQSDSFEIEFPRKPFIPPDLP